MSSSRPEVDDPDDVSALATEQRREFMAAMTIESDLDFAFQLQLQEAINASLSLEPSTSSTPTLPTQLPPMEVKDAHLSDKVVSVTLPGIQSEEILKFEQELKDRSISEAEFRKLRDDLHRRLHDQKLAEEIERMPEDEWEEFGDNYESPFGEGSSKSLSNEIFRVYFKGLVETEEEVAVDRNKKGGLRGQIFGGIGVAITDSRDELLFELRKPLFGDGMSKQIAGIKALIEGLNAAFSLELERIVFYCDQFPIYQFATGKWAPKQRKIAALMKEVTLLREKFAYCQPFFVGRNDIKFAFKLAREAILSQINRPAESSVARNPYETCAICLEDTDANKIFSIDDCMHRYCYSCMKQHVEAKLLHGMLPKCPHESCNSELRVDSCSKFLTPKLVEIMKQRIKESSIPVTEKVYCPNPKCSALMSKIEALEYSKSVLVGVEIFGRGICKECNGRFCVHCKVPWHYNMTCSEYKRRFPNPPAEDMKLKTLAARNLWRQCIKCNHMIELAAGCYHMTCRCGYEFCYTCGSEWKNKKATCSCPLWDEDFIMDEDEDEEEDEDEDEDEDEEDVDEDFDEEDYESSSEYLFFVN